MSAIQRAERLQREAAYRLRSKFHAQSTRASKAQQAFSYSPAAKANKIMELVMKHKERPLTVTADQAAQEIRAFRIPTLDEDPLLKASRRVLKAISYFRLAGEQTCDDLVEMHCLHTYGLDAEAVGELFTIMKRMGYARYTQAVMRLAPRVEMLAQDLTVNECGGILTVFGKCPEASRPKSTIKALCATIKKYSTDETDAAFICSIVYSVAQCDQLQAKVLLGVYSAPLQRALAAGEQQAGTIRDLSYAIAGAGGGPRPLLNALCRAAVGCALQLSAKDIADVMHCMHVCGHRGEAVLRRLASVQLTQPESQTPETIALTLAALSHFNIFDPDMYLGLVQSVVGTMDGEQAASVFLSCGRVRCYQPWVQELLLPKFMLSLKQQSTRAICAVLLFIAEGRLADQLTNSTVLILKELRRRGPDVRAREDVMRSVQALQLHAQATATLEQASALMQA